MILYIPKTEHCDWYEPIEGSYDDVLEAIRNPTTKYLSKDEVSLWAFYTPKDHPDLGYWKKPKFNASNMLNCYALLLDFDNDATASKYISVDDAIQEFSDFRFALYTSYRHRPDHNKFRLVVPLKTPMRNDWFQFDCVKQWFIEKFPGVDIRASIKTLQKHKIPAHHPDDTNYRYYINEAPELELPLDKFNDDIYYEILLQPEPVKRIHKGFLRLTIEDIEDNIKYSCIVGKHEKELSEMKWERGSGYDVHGNLCRIAASLQQHGVGDWEEIMLSYAPNNPVIIAEIRRMRMT